MKRMLLWILVAAALTLTHAKQQDVSSIQGDHREHLRDGFAALARGLEGATGAGRVKNCGAVTSAYGELRHACGEACKEFVLPDFCAAGGAWADGGSCSGGGGGNSGGDGSCSGSGGISGRGRGGGGWFSGALLMRCGSGLVAATLIFVPVYPPAFTLALRLFGISGGEEHSLGEVVSYKLDYWLSTSTTSKPVTLALITVWVFAVGTAGLQVSRGDSLWDASWTALQGVGFDWTFIIKDGEHAGLSARVVAFLTSLGGMLVTALLLGIVGEAISDKVDDMKKGKSKVIEADHVVILGWNSKVCGMVRQFSLANESEGGGCVVILADDDKEVLEERVIEVLGSLNLQGTRVIIRGGKPFLISDLLKISAHKAKAIIVTSPDDDYVDAFSLQAVLALKALEVKHTEHSRLNGHVVVEVNSGANENLIINVGGATMKIYPVVTHDAIGRLMIQCSLQPGLAKVFLALLGFEGNEFYCQTKPEWTKHVAGQKFGDVLMRFEHAVPVGFRRGDRTVINPSDHEVLIEGDQLLVLAEDNDTYEPGPAPQIVDDGVVPHYTEVKRVIRMLFVGWRRDIHDMLLVTDSFVPPGSELWLYDDTPVDQRMREFDDIGFKESSLQNLTVFHHTGNSGSRRHLEQLDFSRFTSILVLAEDGFGKGHEVLVTMMLIRDIQATRMVRAKKMTNKWRSKLSTSEENLKGFGAGSGSSGGKLDKFGLASKFLQVAGSAAEEKSHHLRSAKSVTVVAEILDPTTRRLVMDANAGDFVLSNEIVSMAMAMLAEDFVLHGVLKELLWSADGNEIYIRPTAQYLHPGERLTYYELLRRARLRRQIVMGYLDREGTPVLNPEGKGEPRLWEELAAKGLVVLAEDDGCDDDSAATAATAAA